jgi:hypothetical protein
MPRADGATPRRAGQRPSCSSTSAILEVKMIAPLGPTTPARRLRRPSIAPLLAVTFTRLLTLTLAVTVTDIGARAATLRVPGDQPTLGAALDLTAPGDTVLVAAGLYSGPGNVGLTAPMHDFVLRSEQGAAQTTIDCAGQHRFLWMQAHTRATHIEGFTLQGGDATGEIYTGGGLIVGFGASPTLSDCSFLASRGGNNLSNGGGALAFHNSAPLIERCHFEGNRSEGLYGIGGAISLYTSPAVIQDCTFSNNWTAGTLAAGGAVFAWDFSSITLERCTFAGNQCVAEGGAVFVSFSFDGSTFSGCRFVGNQAHTAGAVFMVSGSRVLDCGFEENSAQYGGALEEVGGLASQISDCLFLDNEAGVRGGAMRIVDAASTVEGCIFARNSAPEGGAIAIHGADPTIASSTFFDNAAPTGSALALLPTQVGSHVTLTRSILVAGRLGAATSCGYDCTLTASCTDAYGNAGGDWVACLAGQLGIDGNFSEDPRFCAPLADDWTLDASSPCLPGQHPSGASCGLIGAQSQGCGATAVAPTTWGRLKALYGDPSPAP